MPFSAILTPEKAFYCIKISRNIDPPYNTGNDFVYNDDFAEDADSYLDRSGQFDEDGNRIVQNTESNGRFHTDFPTDDAIRKVVYMSVPRFQRSGLCRFATGDLLTLSS